MSQASDLPIRSRELVQCGMCTKGQKQWFSEHGLDFTDFLKNGVAVEVLLATGDGLATKAVEMVRARRGQ
jgi:hypothetical protein